MRIILSAAVAALMASAAFAEVTVETAQGPVALPGTPEKVAALDLGVADSMMALGVTPVAVQDKLYLDHLQPLAQSAAPAGTGPWVSSGAFQSSCPLAAAASTATRLSSAMRAKRNSSRCGHGLDSMPPS